jgi:myo-inositol-1(or 4)-monophosphatase
VAEPSPAPNPVADPASPSGAWSGLEALARSVALDAAVLLRSGLGHRRRRIDNKSTATDHVTEMDREAEQLIVERLLAARPDDGVMGEEGADRPGTSGVRWIIDPIDGTTNYVYGFPAFAVSIAARAGDEVVAGAVVDVSADDVYTAHRGGGATRNGEPIRCSAAADLGTALVATGFSYEAARRERQARVLTTVLPRVRDIRRMGAAALDLCAVASGRVDAYYERGLGAWDFAAGALIAAEAGALVRDLNGGAPSPAFVLAAPVGIAGELAALLRDAGAGEA